MLFVASASLAEAVMPTTVPTAAFSSTALAVPSVSVTTADIEFIDIVDLDRERPGLERSVGRCRSHRDVAAGSVGFAVNRCRRR